MTPRFRPNDRVWLVDHAVHGIVETVIHSPLSPRYHVRANDGVTHLNVPPDALRMAKPGLIWAMEAAHA